MLIPKSLSLVTMHICALLPSFDTLAYPFVLVGGEVLVQKPSIMMSLLPEFSLRSFVHLSISVGSARKVIDDTLTGSIHLLQVSCSDLDDFDVGVWG